VRMLSTLCWGIILGFAISCINIGNAANDLLQRLQRRSIAALLVEGNTSIRSDMKNIALSFVRNNIVTHFSGADFCREVIS